MGRRSARTSFTSRVIAALCLTTIPAATPAMAQAAHAAPDLVVLSFDNPADDRLIKNAGTDLVSYQTWDPTGGRGGSRALRITVDQRYSAEFGAIGPVWPRRGRVFVRWYFRTQGTPAGNVKGMRFHADFSNAGEVYGGSAPCWSFDWEPEGWAGACFPSGMYYGRAPAKDLANGITPTCEHLADGNWHSIEVDYDRNAGPNVEVRLWCDGKAVVLPDGQSPRYFDQAVTGARWIGGDRASNTPTTLRAKRMNRNYITGFYFWPTISQAQGTATVWIDDVAASSRRIGP